MKKLVISLLSAALFVGILIAFINPQITIVPHEDSDAIGCTMEALQCPDGSYVGRTGPNCEFAACPVIEEPSDGDTDANPPLDAVVCTMDARECPDGTFVGRVAPNCEFAACGNGEQPNAPIVINDDPILCSDESRLAEACIEIYAPVCGLTKVECVTEPCEPVPETYSNSCFACQNERVVSYTEGECRAF